MVCKAHGQQTVGVPLQKRCKRPGDKSGGQYPLARWLPREVMEGKQHSHTLGALGAAA